MCLWYISFQAKIDHGTHVRSLMLKMDALQRKHFDEAVSSFVRSCTKYLLNSLPLDNQIIKYARFFHTSLRTKHCCTKRHNSTDTIYSSSIRHRLNEEVFQVGKCSYKIRPLLWRRSSEITKPIRQKTKMKKAMKRREDYNIQIGNMLLDC